MLPIWLPRHLFTSSPHLSYLSQTKLIALWFFNLSLCVGARESPAGSSDLGQGITKLFDGLLSLLSSALSARLGYPKLCCLQLYHLWCILINAFSYPTTISFSHCLHTDQPILPLVTAMRGCTNSCSPVGRPGAWRKHQPTLSYLFEPTHFHTYRFNAKHLDHKRVSEHCMHECCWIQTATLDRYSGLPQTVKNKTKQKINKQMSAGQ